MLGYLQKDFAGVVKALGEGKLKPTKMITSKIKIDRVVEDGYNAYVPLEFFFVAQVFLLLIWLTRLLG